MTKIGLWLALLLGLVGCSGGGVNAPTPVPPTPTPTPQQLLERGVQTFNATESFHFDLLLENRSLAVDTTGALAFNQAQGDVRPPDQFQASSTIQTPLGAIALSYISIGDQQWVTNPLDQTWSEAPPELRSNVSQLFTPDTGLAKFMSDLENLERLPDEGGDIHLRGTLPGEALALFAPDLASQEQITVDLFFAADSFLLNRAIMTEAAVDGVAPTWTFTFTQHNAAPEINPPI